VSYLDRLLFVRLRLAHRLRGLRTLVAVIATALVGAAVGFVVARPDIHALSLHGSAASTKSLAPAAGGSAPPREITVIRPVTMVQTVTVRQSPTIQRPRPTVVVTRYKVRKGDTLSAIAARKYGDIRRGMKLIKRANGLHSNLILRGESLVLPPRTPQGSAATTR
jgi:LysM repeat protein